MPLSCQLGGHSPSSSSTAPTLCERGSRDERHRAAHEIGGPEVDYRVVIPTRGRWRPACEIAPGRLLKNERRPFILVKTLAFLKRQAISPARVTLYVSDDEEKRKYEDALAQDTYWAGVALEVGRPGIMAQRNFIVNSLPEGAYVVSFDDDVSDIRWMHRPGSMELLPLPDRSLEMLFFHAHSLLCKHKAFIWGLNTTCSLNPRVMWSDGVSARNGEINGFCYGFINRHATSLQPQIADATEDAERSLRFFRKDRIVLRYRMYAGETKCFKFSQGLQAQFDGSSVNEQNQARKVAEREASQKILQKFGDQVLPPREKKGISTLEIRFRPIPSVSPIPVNPHDIFKKACEQDMAARSGKQGAGSADEEAEPKRGRGKKRKVEKADAGSETAQKLSRSASSPGEDASSSLGRPGPARPLRDRKLSVQDSDDESSSSDSEESEAYREGVDEHRQHESIMVMLRSGGQDASAQRESEDDVLRRVLEESRRDLVFLHNGDVEDPMEEALKKSRELEEEEQLQRRKEEEEFEKALRLSAAEADAEPAASSGSGDGQPQGPGQAQPTELEVKTSDDFDGQLVQLVDMGFDPLKAAASLRCSSGDLAEAIVQLVDAT